MGSPEISFPNTGCYHSKEGEKKETPALQNMLLGMPETDISEHSKKRKHIQSKMSNGGLNMLQSLFLIYLIVSLARELGYIRIDCSLFSPTELQGGGWGQLRKAMINKSNFLRQKQFFPIRSCFMNSEQCPLQPFSHPGLQFGFLAFCLPHHALPCTSSSMTELIASCSVSEREDESGEPWTHTVRSGVPLGLKRGPLLLR